MTPVTAMDKLRSILKEVHYYANRRRVSICGHTFVLPRHLVPAFNLWHNNEYDPPLSRFLQGCVNPGDTFVDVGANIGILSLLMAKHVGETGKVFAFEPNPYVYPLLVQLLDVNGFSDRCTLLPLGLAEAPGILKLVVSTFGSQTMARASIVRFDPNAKEVDIMCTTLDLMLNAIPKVKCIKVDVEGAELKVLSGAVQVLTYAHPIVCVEVHGLYFQNPADLVERLFSLFSNVGYSAWNLLKGKEETIEGFLADSGIRGWDPLTQKDLSKSGYGQLIFAPTVRRSLVEEVLRTT